MARTGAVVVITLDGDESGPTAESHNFISACQGGFNRFWLYVARCSNKSTRMKSRTRRHPTFSLYSNSQGLASRIPLKILSSRTFPSRRRAMNIWAF